MCPQYADDATRFASGGTLAATLKDDAGGILDTVTYHVAEETKAKRVGNAVLTLTFGKALLTGDWVTG